MLICLIDFSMIKVDKLSIKILEVSFIILLDLISNLIFHRQTL